MLGGGRDEAGEGGEEGLEARSRQADELPREERCKAEGERGEQGSATRARRVLGDAAEQSDDLGVALVKLHKVLYGVVVTRCRSTFESVTKRGEGKVDVRLPLFVTMLAASTT